MATSKDRQPIEVEVPPEFAAEFLTKHMGTAPDKRPVLTLKLGDADLGTWQVWAVRSHRDTVAGYGWAIATLRAVWP